MNENAEENEETRERKGRLRSFFLSLQEIEKSDKEEE